MKSLCYISYICCIILVACRIQNPPKHFVPENTSAASWKQLLQILEKAVAIAEKYQVYLGIEPEEAVDLLNNNIWMAHAKDRDLMGNIRAPGKGDIDFRFYISKLKGNRFQWLFGNAWT